MVVGLGGIDEAEVVDLGGGLLQRGAQVGEVAQVQVEVGAGGHVAVAAGQPVPLEGARLAQVGRQVDRRLRDRESEEGQLVAIDQVGGVQHALALQQPGGMVVGVEGVGKALHLHPQVLEAEAAVRPANGLVGQRQRAAQPLHLVGRLHRGDEPRLDARALGIVQQHLHVGDVVGVEVGIDDGGDGLVRHRADAFQDGLGAVLRRVEHQHALVAHVEQRVVEGLVRPPGARPQLLHDGGIGQAAGQQRGHPLIGLWQRGGRRLHIPGAGGGGGRRQRRLGTNGRRDEQGGCSQQIGRAKGVDTHVRQSE